MFPKNWHGLNKDYTKPDIIEKHHRKTTQNEGYFNGRWKDTYDQIRDINNQKRAYFTACEESGFAHGREGDVEVHMGTKSPHHHKMGKFLSQSKNFVSPKDTDTQLDIATTVQTHITIPFCQWLNETE